MKDWLRGKRTGLVTFLVVAGLVVGGLGWVTAAALRLEREQQEERAAADRENRVRLALWRMVGIVSPLMAREHNRPFNHYSAVYAAPLAFNPGGQCLIPGAVMEPSPLLNVELRPWMRLHFQMSEKSGWESPQVLGAPDDPAQPAASRLRLMLTKHRVPLDNVTAERARLLRELACALPPRMLLSLARQRVSPATLRDTTLLAGGQERLFAQPLPEQQAGNSLRMNQGRGQADGANRDDFAQRRDLSNYVMNEGANPQRLPLDLVLDNVRNGADWFSPDGNARKIAHGVETEVALSPMTALWVAGADDVERLFLLRQVRVDTHEIWQGILLDDQALRSELAALVEDLLPGVTVVPVRETDPDQPGRTLADLPFRLDPGPLDGVDGGELRTTLRVGLALAWAAALTALLAVGLGGWSLLDLSERRIRFVSAVTHELRTPLTTLRLYLDMLMSGLVRDEQQREEYIRTLHAEADRLARLVGNVLDYSRLENQRPRLSWANTTPTEIVTQAEDTWRSRCTDATKEWILDADASADGTLHTDAGLVLQILGNLIDNACKYSRDAADRRLWLRVRRDGRKAIFDVEDRGPGVAVRDRRSIFRSFRRGSGTDVTAGGVGLGLALARRWARLLGGQLVLRPAAPEGGACFRLTLPCRPPLV